MGPLCSRVDFSSSTSYKPFSTFLSLLNSGSLIDVFFHRSDIM